MLLEWHPVTDSHSLFPSCYVCSQQACFVYLQPNETAFGGTTSVGWHLHRRNGYWFPREKARCERRKMGSSLRILLAEFKGKYYGPCPRAWARCRWTEMQKNGSRGIRMEEKMLAGPSPFLLHWALVCIVCRGSDTRQSGLAATRQQLDASVVWP